MSDKNLKVTSAAEYRKIRAAAKPTETHIVPMPSGANWELCIPDLSGYIMTGRLPRSLITDFLAAAEKSGIKPAEIEANLDKVVDAVSVPEMVDSLIFMRQIVSDAMVNPRIVPGGTGANELDPTEVDPRDFKYTFHWVLAHQGVAGLAGLQQFRSRRERRASASSTGRKKLRQAAVTSTKSRR